MRSGGMLGRRPVEAAREVRARHDAEAAADAPAVVDDDDAVGLLPGGAHGAGADAGRVVALVALHGQVELALGGHLLVGPVVRRRLAEVEGAGLHLEDADVPHLRIVGQVVLAGAGLDAAPAAVANREVQRVGELDAVDRRRVGDVRGHARPRERLLLDAPEDALLVDVRELLVVLPEELLGRRRALPAPARRRRGGGQTRELEEGAPRARLLEAVLDQLLHALFGRDDAVAGVRELLGLITPCHGSPRATRAAAWCAARPARAPGVMRGK